MKKFIVKGRIRKFVKWGKKGELRRGSYQFLPDTEVVLTDNNLAYNPRIQNRFWVRGKSKTGLLTTKGIYFKYLTDLTVEEVKNANSKTLDFISKNGILFFEENQKNEINDWLEYFEELSIAENLSSEVKDKLFKNAQEFVELIQSQINQNNKNQLIENHLEFPIIVRHFKNLKDEEIVKREDFNLQMKEYFLNDVCDSILKTDVDSIFPTDKKMLIGNVEVEIKNSSNFKITKIIFAKKEHGIEHVT